MSEGVRGGYVTSLMECLLGKWLRHRGAALVKGLTKGKRRAPKLFRPRRVRPCLEVLEDILAPAVFTVTSLTDDGTGAAGTLSAAINGANANPNSTIDFNLPGGAPQTIDVTGTLPAITAPTFIDGFSQGGDNRSCPIRLAAPSGPTMDLSCA
jgi:hypothetical protein